MFENKDEFENLFEFLPGIVLVDKSVGISSNKVVNKVKYALKAKKCGHLGTLDLEGAGLLPVTVNKATKLFDYFLQKDKTYESIFVFGFETDTLDMSGQVTKQKDCDVSSEEICLAIEKMVGKYSQMPPMYSAKKIGGKVAYKEALKGNVLELRPKEVEIFEFKLLEKVCKNTFKFEISCSSGTFIRSLCKDLAEKIGTYGTMQCITRTRCDMFYLKDANTLEEIEKGQIKILPCENLFQFESLALMKDELEKILNGQVLECDAKNGFYKLFYQEKFLGVGEVFDGDLKFKIRLV